MCLAIPGRIVEIIDPALQIARAEVGGVRRNIHIGLVAEDGIVPGDWVLIHVGFALSKINEREAQETLDALEAIGAAYRQELEDLQTSQIK
jgi:hydrogenase expression/formation protein HypC